MQNTKRHIAFIEWLSKSLAFSMTGFSLVTHKGFRTVSPESDYIEIEKEVAFATRTQKRAMSYPDNMNCMTRVKNCTEDKKEVR